MFAPAFGSTRRLLGARLTTAGARPRVDDDEDIEPLLEFAVEYGQSLDYILLGDVGGMICGLAASTRRPDPDDGVALPWRQAT